MRGRSLLLTLLTLSLSLAGCFSGDGEAPPVEANATAPTIEITSDRPDPTFNDVQAGTSVGPDTEATLERAPELRVGEWWKIAFESPIDGQKVEFIRVVAGVQDGKYIVGMPHEGWYKEAVIYHAPGFGDINADLSYNTHDVLFTPVKFPLTDGATWKTSFSGGPQADANVKVNSDGTATVTFTLPDAGILGTPVGADGNPNVVLEIVYDPKIHEVSEFRHPTATYKVVDHGYDFQGWVTVPRGERLIFFHGRIGPALDINLQPAAPVETVEIAGGYNRVTFIQAIQSIGPGGGVGMEKATAPDGTVYETQWVPHTGGFQTRFYEHADPDGTWTLEHVAGGNNAVFIEGIAYHQYDIRLPDGAIRSDHSHEVIR